MFCLARICAAGPGEGVFFSSFDFSLGEPLGVCAGGLSAEPQWRYLFRLFLDSGRCHSGKDAPGPMVDRVGPSVLSILLDLRGRAKGTGILDQGWGELRRHLDSRLHWAGGMLLPVPPPNTSMTCPEYGHVSTENRSDFPLR